MSPRVLRRVVAPSFTAPRVVLAIWVAVWVCAVIIQVLALRVDTGTSTFLDRTGPQWATYQRAVREFGGDEYIAIAIEGEGPYDWQLLSELPDLSDALSALPDVRRVDSLASVPLLRLDDDGAISTAAAVEPGIPASQEERDRLRSDIESDPIADRYLISKDRRSVGLSVMFEGDLDADRSATVRRVREILAPYSVAIAGVPIFRTEINFRTQREVALFVPLTLFLIGGLVYLWVGSFAAALALLLVGGIGSSLTLAAMAGTGVPLSLSTMLLPTVLIALGCAYSAHIIIAVAADPATCTLERVSEVLPGIVWSGITTAIGFAAMSATTVDSIWQLAAYGSLGVFFVTFATVSLVPALLILLKAVPVESSAFRMANLVGGATARWSARYRVLVVGSWLAGSIAIGLGVFRLEVDTNIIEWFARGDSIRQGYEIIRQEFSGITPVSVVVRSAAEGRVVETDVLTAIETMRTELETLPSVGRALAITQPLGSLRKAFGREGLPETEAEAEQYLLILEGEEQLNDLVSDDRRAASIWLRLDSNDADDILATSKWVNRWWAVNGIEGFTVETTGVMFEFARAQNAIALSQLRGLVIAIVAVGIVLCVALRSPCSSLIAMIPNALPIALAFGSMGYLGIPLDAATVCLGSLALGIAVDDTVHVMFLARGRRVSMAGAGWAGRVAPSATFPALILTTACIAVGFGVLGLSSFVLVRNLGIVTAVVVVVCLLADLTLLPALLGGDWGDAQASS